MTSVLNAIKVPFHRVSLGEEEIQAVSDVLRSGWLTMGEKTFEFERKFAAYIGVKHSIAVSSGTAALHLSLDAIGLQAGDEVLLPTTTFTATAEVVTYMGARPVFVDIDPLTMNISPADAERRITSHTRAVFRSTLRGNPVICRLYTIWQRIINSTSWRMLLMLCHLLIRTSVWAQSVN